MKATAQAHANIALVKYWGKRNIELNLPGAGSLSMTLGGLTTTTTVTFGESAVDRMILNGKQSTDAALVKALKVVDPLRQIAGMDASVTIDSTNDFPTGAGLASSASGLAALTLATSAAAGLELPMNQLSAIARVGSGSASRSLFGGFSEWRSGQLEDGTDSYAVPLFPAEHWDLRVVVAVVDQGKKHVGSTDGMEHTRHTSPFHQPYLDSVDVDLALARRAIEERDFHELGQVSEHSCLKMHAAMMAAKPALVYLKAESFMVIDAVRQLRNDGAQVFFTADAGPNIKVFCLPDSVEQVRAKLLTMPCVRQLVTCGPGGPARIIGASS